MNVNTAQTQVKVPSISHVTCEFIVRFTDLRVMAEETNSAQRQEDARLRDAIAHQRRIQQYCMWLNDTRLRTQRAAVDWPPPTTIQV